MSKAFKALLAADTEEKRRAWWEDFTAQRYGYNRVDPDLLEMGITTMERERGPVLQAMLDELPLEVQAHGRVTEARGIDAGLWEQEVLLLTVVFPDGKP